MTSPAPAPSPAGCELGPTAHCRAGRHHACNHRAGAACAGGVWLPEGYVTIGYGGVVCAQIVRPSHVYRCPCECHS